MPPPSSPFVALLAPESFCVIKLPMSMFKGQGSPFQQTRLSQSSDTLADQLLRYHALQRRWDTTRDGNGGQLARSLRSFTTQMKSRAEPDAQPDGPSGYPSIWRLLFGARSRLRLTSQALL